MFLNRKEEKKENNITLKCGIKLLKKQTKNFIQINIVIEINK